MTTDAGTAAGFSIAVEELHRSLRDPVLASMDLLNEISEQYPQAISFAAGRPTDEFFAPERIGHYLAVYRRYLSEQAGVASADIRRTLFQYGRTKGVIHDVIARQLRTDEIISVDPGSIVVTVGCQEAMLLVIRTLCAGERDVMLAASPYYVGFAGAAALLDVAVLPVAAGTDGVDPDDLRRQVRAARAQGLRPRGCYLVPDFSNPTGACLGLGLRRELLALAQSEQLLLIEDNPYGLFGSAARLPTLKSLDQDSHVIYLGSFAKTVMPSARIGYVVADQPVRRGNRLDGVLADHLAAVKSMVTVNTSAIAQAVVAGKLIENDFSLVGAVGPEKRRYAANRQRMLAGLTARFGTTGPVSWTTPAGGFFTVVTLPFAVDDDLLRRSAADYGVSWIPMSHFYAGRGGDRQLRLSWSSVTAAQIDEGLNRLLALVRDRMREPRQ